VLVAAVFLGIRDSKDAETVFVTNPDIEISSPAPATTDEKKTAPAPNVFPPQYARRNNRSRIIRTQPVTERKPKTKDPRPTDVALTKEERYAYRQLMLALTVSSSNLKVVQDAINGNENIEHTNSTNQR